jgi:hypothetical protein
MARLNDTEAIAAKPINGGESANPDTTGAKFASPQWPAPPEGMTLPARPSSPDRNRSLRGAVAYLNGTACK